jgi:putative ABC transport system permease protein
MRLHPTISALRHHGITVLLIIIEVALTCAVVSNLLYLTADRVAWQSMQTGLADQELIWIRTNQLKQDTDVSALQIEDLQELRSIYGVKSAVLINSLPLTPLGREENVWTKPGKTSGGINSSVVIGSRGFLEAAGVKLIEGRFFVDSDYASLTDPNAPTPQTAIITKAFADRLWPGQSALGQHLFIGPNDFNGTQIVGVVEHLLRSKVTSADNRENVVMLPASSFNGGFYLLRVNPEIRDRILREVPTALDKVDPNRLIVKNEAYSDTLSQYFRGDRSLTILLSVIVLIFIAVTAFGIIGLTSFWVQRRRRHIGVRRALGARRIDIMKYFLIENAVIVGAGALIGVVLSLFVSSWLMMTYEVPRLPLFWAFGGGVILIVVGQLSVLGPAIRAAQVSPQEAIRT